MGGSVIKTGNKDADTGLMAASLLLSMGSGGSGGSYGNAATPAASSNATASSLGGMSQASSAITPSFSSMGSGFSSGATSSLGSMSNGLGHIGNAALGNSLTYSPIASGITGAGITGNGIGGGTGSIGGVAGSQIQENGLSQAIKKLQKMNEGVQDIMNRRNEYEQQPEAMPQPISTPNFFSGDSGPSQSLINNSQSGQPLDQFSQRLQVELQKIIDKQKNGRW